MSRQSILQLYIDQLEESERHCKQRNAEIRKFLNFCFEHRDDQVDYTSLQSWLKVRERTLNSSGMVVVQNRVADFTNWARLLDHTIGRVPKVKSHKRDRRKPIILDRSQVSSFVKLQKSIPSRKGINPRTFALITGLLFCTGLRVGEALSLTADDVDLKKRTIYIPSGKGESDRTLGISKSTCEKLLEYRAWAKCFEKHSRRFFIYDKVNLKAPYSLYLDNFRTVAIQLGLRSSAKGRLRSNFTIHDLRHSFAVNSLIKIYESEVDVNEAIVELSCVLGHKTLESTYWYIEAVPRLTAAAFKRAMR